MRSIFICVLSYLFTVTTAFGQKNFEPGSITLNSGEVIKGFIDNRKRMKTPSDINFRETELGVNKTYVIKDLKAFSIGDNESYVRKTVSVDNNSINLNTMTSYDPALVTKETVWLRQLVKGPLLNVYEYNTNRFHFYMQQEDSLIYELIYKADASVTPAQLIFVFRNQLLSALSEKPLSSKAKFLITRAEYSEESFFRIGRAVNGEQAATGVGGDQVSQPARYFIGAGVRFATFFNFNSSDPKLNSITLTNSSMSPVIIGGVDVLPLRSVHDFVIHAEISLNQVSLKGKGVSKSSVYTYNNEYSLKQTRVTPSLFIYYNVLTSDAVKVNLGLGGGFNLNFTSENKFVWVIGTAKSETENYPDVRKLWLAEYARVGVILANHVEISGLYQFAGSAFTVAQVAKKEKPIFLRVSYIF